MKETDAQVLIRKVQQLCDVVFIADKDYYKGLLIHSHAYPYSAPARNGMMACSQCTSDNNDSNPNLHCHLHPPPIHPTSSSTNPLYSHQR